jgi:hypothetical protein
MAVVWAELERELDAERAIQWIAAKQARGEHFGTVPLGYSRANGDLRLSVARPEAKLVRQIFELYGTGTYSDLSLARHLNLLGNRARNGQEITEKMVRTVLNNHQLYRGYIKRHWRRPDRELIKGSHPALISEAKRSGRSAFANRTCRRSSEKAVNEKPHNVEPISSPASCAAGIAEAPCGARPPPTSTAETIDAGTWASNDVNRRWSTRKSSSARCSSCCAGSTSRSRLRRTSPRL